MMGQAQETLQFLATVEGPLKWLIIVLGIGLLIFVHEWGHFMACRLVGVKVFVFSLGFGQRIWGFERKGVDYRISALPFGGYVSYAGMEPGKVSDDPQDFNSKGFWAKVLVISGGVIMNAVLAVVLYWIVMINGIWEPSNKVGVTPGLPAWQAGIQSGDRVTGMSILYDNETREEKKIATFEDLIYASALTGENDRIDITVERDGKTLTFNNLQSVVDDDKKIPLLGFQGYHSPRIEGVNAFSKKSFEVGDLITAVKISTRTLPITDATQLPHLISHYKDQDLSFVIQRKDQTLTVPFAAQKKTLADIDPKVLKQKPLRIGILYRSFSQEVKAVVKNSLLDRKGIQKGDTLIAVNGQASPFPSDQWIFMGTPVQSLTFRRNNEPYTIQAGPEEDFSLSRKDVFFEPYEKAQLVEKVYAGSPADLAGIKSGDLMWAALRKGDKQERPAKPMPYKTFAKNVSKAGKDPVTVWWQTPEGEFKTQQIKPDHYLPTQYLLNLDFQADRIYTKKSVGAALGAGMVRAWRDLINVGKTLSQMVKGRIGTKNLGGPIGIAQFSSKSLESGFATFLKFLAMISMNLALLNILPIPVFDGGNLLFVIIEKLKGSPIGERSMAAANYVGLAVILCILVLVMYNDIGRLLG